MVLNGGDGAMNKQLADLIRDYQARVHEALVLMDRSGIRMPYSSLDGLRRIFQRGLLDGDVVYLKHGAGCTVYFQDGD